MAKLYKIYCRSYQKAFKIATTFLPWKAPEIVSGEDSVLKIPEILKKKGIKRVLLVTDGGLMKLGLPGGLINALEKSGIKCSVFSDVQPNPTIINVENAKDAYIRNDCQA